MVETFPDYELTLIDCSDEIGEVLQFSPDRPYVAADARLADGGGTDLCPPFEWLLASDETPAVMLYLTDGIGPAPERAPPWPVLWVLVPDGSPPAAWGEVVWMTRESAREFEGP